MTNASVCPVFSIMKSFLASLHLKEQGRISFMTKTVNFHPLRTKTKSYILHFRLIALYIKYLSRCTLLKILHKNSHFCK